MVRAEQIHRIESYQLTLDDRAGEGPCQAVKYEVFSDGLIRDARDLETITTTAKALLKEGQQDIVALFVPEKGRV